MIHMQMGPHGMMSLDSKEQGHMMQREHLETNEQGI